MRPARVSDSSAPVISFDRHMSSCGSPDYKSLAPRHRRTVFGASSHRCLAFVLASKCITPRLPPGGPRSATPGTKFIQPQIIRHHVIDDRDAKRLLDFGHRHQAEIGMRGARLERLQDQVLTLPRVITAHKQNLERSSSLDRPGARLAVSTAGGKTLTLSTGRCRSRPTTFDPHTAASFHCCVITEPHRPGSTRREDACPRRRHAQPAPQSARLSTFGGRPQRSKVDL